MILRQNPLLNPSWSKQLAHWCHVKDQFALEPHSVTRWCLILYLHVQKRKDQVESVCTSDFPTILAFKYHFAYLKMQEICSLVEHLLKSQPFTIQLYSFLV